MVRAFVLSAALAAVSFGCNNEASSSGATSPADASATSPDPSSPSSDGTPATSADSGGGAPLTSEADAAPNTTVCGVDVDAGVCPPGSACKSDPPVDVPDASTHEQPAGGHCGGIAGYQCARGLVCTGKGSYPDAMGTCALNSHCTK
ncbi:MAG: hypothetical protein ABI332_02805 [Polyangiaceae bacterium]